MKLTSKYLQILCVLFSVLIQSCAEDVSLPHAVDSSITEFIESEDFKIQGISKSDIDFRLSQISYVEGDPEKPVLHIFFRNKGGVGIIDAIKVTEKSSKIKKLPNNQDYAMILKDYSRFKMESNSGFINIYDLNYDDSHISTIEIGNNKILNLESYRIEPEVLIKHGYITDDRYSKAQDSDNFNFRSQELNLEDFPSSCSGGSDNNVSWGECYDCLTSICGDSDCQETLDLTNIFSFYNGFPPLGDLAIGAACVYISAVN